MYDLVEKGVQFAAERREEVLKTEDEKEKDEKKAKHSTRNFVCQTGLHGSDDQNLRFCIGRFSIQ